MTRQSITLAKQNDEWLKEKTSKALFFLIIYENGI